MWFYLCFRKKELEYNLIHSCYYLLQTVLYYSLKTSIPRMVAVKVKKLKLKDNRKKFRELKKTYFKAAGLPKTRQNGFVKK